jgi:hypothetical protein
MTTAGELIIGAGVTVVGEARTATGIAPGEIAVPVEGEGGSVDLGPLTARVDDHETRIDTLETTPAAYTHTQVTPATVWIISHPLPFEPAGIEVVDHAGTQHYPQVTYPDASTVRLAFRRTIYGTARLS